MPRIKRWFPVSQDINSDVEMWELTDKFGDRALRVWLEILSIGDRNDGVLPGLWKDYPRLLAARCRSTARHLQGVCEWVARWLDVNSEGVASIRNFAKYHRPREHKPLPSEPILTKPSKKHKNASSLPPPPAEAIECAQLLSDKIFNNFPTRTAPTESQLTSWAHEAERLNRIDSHSWAEIHDLIEWCQEDDFWRANILSMSKLREKWNQLTAKKEKPNGSRTAEPKGFAGLEEWRRRRGINSR